jgi:hypothetical protein
MKSYEEKAYSALKRIEEETEYRRKTKKNITRILTPVMSLCLAAILGIGIWQSGMFEQSDTPIQGDTSNQSGISVSSTSNDANSALPPKNEYAVYTDSVNLPENTSGAEMDMIGCLVYKGKVYTQSTDLYTYNSVIADQLVGEYIGESKGTLDCWSSQEDWATEFASTYSGPVYKVNGYSEDFRLCIYVNSGDTQWLQFLDNYDGIGLNTGADLFEKRLHVTGNVESVTYKTHSDWNEGDPTSHRDLTGAAKEQFDDFLNELCNSPFERIDYTDNPGFYQAEKQGHLYLNMKDGTLIELRLIEGGYVGCQNLGWIFVKMPGDLFDTVLTACQ